MQGVGDKRSTIDWIEDLRDEGAAASVLDGLLAPLIEGGLAPWKSADNAKLDPRGPGRQICEDMASDPPEVVAHVLAAVRGVAKYRLPPLHDLRGMLAAARAEYQRSLSRDRDLAMLPAMPVCAPESAAFGEALATFCNAEQMAAWFDPAFVSMLTHSAGWPRVRIATRHRPGMLSQSVGSQARAAARMLWGQDVEVEFVQGRPADAIREAAE